MAKSIKQNVTEYDSPRRFHRQRLLAFLRRNALPSASAASKHKTRVFSDLQHPYSAWCPTAGGRMRAHLATRFLLSPFPGHRGDNYETALRFIAQLHVLDDLDRGELGGAAAAEDLEKQVCAIPPSMASDAHYAEAVRAVFVTRIHPAFWENPVDWRRVSDSASESIRELITEAPEFKRLLRLPRSAIHPRYAIPFGFGGRRRKIGKKQMLLPAASLLARFFHPKGSSSSERMELVEGLIDQALGDGNVGVREHLRFSAGEGVPVASSVGKSCGESSANNNAANKCLDGEDRYGYESAGGGGAKRPRTTGEFCTPDVDQPSPSSGMDPTHVLNKVLELQGFSNTMASLLFKICEHASPDRTMFVENLMRLDKVLLGLRADIMKAEMKDCNSSEMAAAAESCASFSCT